ncbi:hypothetical protein D7B24_007914 [Verticillium nonalfalfae]|uniref:Uncharacterized protein n=1 Tax=Verticillium nonalfalfae TaxID=1051616 RepID=A0A3M9Y821_9PEZI|nr:uncharacterized protein D7B24_007914 [Verticillium nonalfalfae]RNJ55916.1 hypothetical protein D7B24_007914 [Verticillium nonalfalfae]
MATPVDNQTVLIPVKVDAFVFNSKVCDGIPPEPAGTGEGNEPTETRLPIPTAAKIAPITQPNYTFLRLDRDYIQPDIQNPVDLNNSWPSGFNSRFTDLGSDTTRKRRVGVYLHWTMPRLYRSGIAAAGPEVAKGADFRDARAARGLDDLEVENDNGNKNDDQKNNRGAPGTAKGSSPSFPKAPTRWLVIRHISDPASIMPPEARGIVKEFTAWVVESDRLRTLEELGPEEDLQVDVSPFISAADGGVSVADQAEVFIGKKEPIESWSEPLDAPPPPPPPSKKKKPQFIENFSLLASSNQLFADYQPHNSNVFSIVDNFEYTKDKFLVTAKASYYIIGWHSVPADDLFAGSTLGKGLERRRRLELLKLRIKLADKKDQEKEFKNWLGSQADTRLLCHGAMYHVNWDVDKKPAKVPADDFSIHLNSSLPVAVGTTPLDALTTYARAMRKIDPVDSIPHKLEEYIGALERHLLARDDGVEAQQQAKDLLYNWNYLRGDGGQAWHASGAQENGDGGNKDRPIAPPAVLGNLRRLNILQKLLDGVERTTARLRWEMFALWWWLVSDATKQREVNTGPRVRDLHTRVGKLENRRRDLIAEINGLAGPEKTPRTVQPGARPAFHQQRDPTLLVGGVQSGWQYDYLDDLLMRLESQTVTALEKPKPVQLGPDIPKPDATDGPSWSELETIVLPKLPKELRPAIKRLVDEFVLLRPQTEDLEPALPDNVQAPLFHDKKEHRNGDQVKMGPWRDNWNNTQPWFPLFLEWEIEYHHVPFDLWTLAPLSSRTLKTKRLRYGIDGNKVDLAKETKNKDKHKIQGRVLILPQPSFSLEAKIRQLFDSTPASDLGEDKQDHKKDREDDRDEKNNNDKNAEKGKENSGLLDKHKREELLRELHQLSFLSAPLAGLAAHLTTVQQGNHIKPNLRHGGTGEVVPIKEAERKDGGFEAPQLRSIGIETDNTPFGKSMKASTTGEPLFKPATHGQFRLTRLNIIDKFGQAIHAIDPRPSKNPQKVWPCIGEWLAPQLRGDGTAREPNVVERDEGLSRKELSHEDEGNGDDDDVRDEDPKPCEFMQLPPQINQQARLNATFVVRADKTDDADGTEGISTQNGRLLPSSKVSTPFWRPADEWENPIWGWVVINYANTGIQLFLPDGTFYREVRLAGPSGAQTSPEWLPFRPPKAGDRLPENPEMQQLQLLVQRLGGDPNFLHAFWTMIETSTSEMDAAAAPEAYAEFASALIGRPLALVNAGWSLELAADALASQADGEQGDEDGNPKTRPRKPPHGLLPGTGKEQYSFGVKIGDRQRGFDGLVGYFECRESLSSEDTKDLGLELKSIRSDFAPGGNEVKEDPDHLPPVAHSKLVHLNAYYESPEPRNVVDAEEYGRRHNARLKVFGALTDPFVPLHVYSGILPVRELSLPPWTWQGALARMKAFFHAGPIIVTKDVPNFVDDRELAPDVAVTLPDVKHEEGAVGLPAVAGGDWAWLQPYYPGEAKHPSAEDDGGRASDGPVASPAPIEALERYMALPVAAEDERARFDRGPYTALEGYLMMVGREKKSET